jgi:hypothetical protein
MIILTKLVEITWLPGSSTGWGCGYVGVPPGHPWHGLGEPNVQIHGGITWSDSHLPGEPPDGNWWIGFDTAHGGDNPTNCGRAYCESQLELLRQQAESNSTPAPDPFTRERDQLKAELAQARAHNAALLEACQFFLTCATEDNDWARLPECIEKIDSAIALEKGEK